MASSDEHPSEA